MSNVTPLSAFPANRARADLHLAAQALTGIRGHLNGGGTDTDFMLRLASSALRSGSATVDSGTAGTELARYHRGLRALHRHLTVGGTDPAILIGLTVNALTGYSPSTVAEARRFEAEMQVAA